MHPFWKLLIAATASMTAFGIALVVAGDTKSARDILEHGMSAIGVVSVIALMFGVPARSE